MGRILQLISQLEEGGAQRQLSYLVSRAKQHEVEIASLIASPPENLFPFFRNSQAPIHFLSHSNDFYAPEIIPALHKLVEERRYDLVQCWLHQSIIQGVLVSQLRGIPCIASPRSMVDRLRWGGHKKWEQWLISRVLRRADLTLFPSHSAAVDYTDTGWVETSRARVVQNGVDCDHFPYTEGGEALVTVGRISSEKAYGEIETIACDLRNDFPRLRCLAAGEGQRKSEHVEFLGHVDDIREIFRQAGVFISTSQTEGMSNAVLEAQAMGIPAVVRRIGSNSEIIDDEVTGYLVSTTEEFIAAIRRLFGDPKLRRRMGVAARERMIAKFSIGPQVEEIERIQSELL